MSKRNGKIEFLRFIFSVIIMVHHSRKLLGDEECWFLGGSFAVEFFFIVSGYLMMATIEKRIKEQQDVKLGKETGQFIIKKIKTLYPEVFVSWLISVLVVSLIRNNSAFDVIVLFIDTFFEATLIKMSGIYSIAINGVTWYISSMLLSMMILYPLIRKFSDMAIHVIIPCLVLVILGYLCGEYGAPRNPTKWIGFTYKGNLRAFAEIGLGVISYQIVKYSSNFELTKIGKYLISLIEWGSYIVLILYMYFEKASVRDYFFLLIMVIAVTISFSEKGIDAGWFNKRIFYALGKYSLPLYLGHTYYAQNLNKILPISYTNEERMIVYIVCAVITSFAICAGANVIRKYLPGVKKIILK